MSAGIQLKVTVDDAAVKRALRAVLLRMTSLEEPFEEIGEAMLASTHERFRAETDPEGKPWRALTRRYVDRPRKKGGRGGREHPILFRTGNLFRSIVYRAHQFDLEIGTNAKFPGGEYSRAAIHQLGGEPGMAPGPAAIPARPFLGVSDADRKKIGSILTRYLAEAA